ncbi:CDP-glycerol glycerophosphotransferase family protein [Candidatus Neomarinimicrobiota bacterium]
MEVHYVARNIYQYAFTKTLYREVGGDFIIHKARAWAHLVKNFRGFKSKHPSRGLLGTQPKTRLFSDRNYDKLSGFLLSTVAIEYSRNPQRLTTFRMSHGIGNKLGQKTPDSDYDYYFVDGDMQLDWLQSYKRMDIPESKIVRTGNFRFDDVTNQRMDKDQIFKDFGVQDTQRPSVTFAPTWEYGGGTLAKCATRMIQELSRDFNLFIRPHYYDWRSIDHLRKYIREEKIRHVYLVEPWDIRKKDTMENLCLTDLLITDNSSISYQSLIYQMPIILIKVDDEQVLERPVEYDLRRVVDIWDGKTSLHALVEENLATNKYKADLKRLLGNCYYHNDGQATSRAVKFMQSLST